MQSNLRVSHWTLSGVVTPETFASKPSKSNPWKGKIAKRAWKIALRLWDFVIILETCSVQTYWNLQTLVRLFLISHFLNNEKRFLPNTKPRHSTTQQTPQRKSSPCFVLAGIQSSSPALPLPVTFPLDYQARLFHGFVQLGEKISDEVCDRTILVLPYCSQGST
jgi:hypothetical protein